MTVQSTKKQESVTIKGTAGSLLIRFHDNPAAFEYSALLEEFERRLIEGEKFFRGAKVALELGKRELEAHDLEDLLPLLANHGVELEHIISGSQITRSAARQIGLNFKLPGPQNTRPPRPLTPSDSGEAGVAFDTAEMLFVRRTLRSGQVIQHHSDVLIMGDVNPGAEIVAGGSIFVWGVLRGIAQAGVNEDTSDASKAVVCALQLNPARLSIGRLITRAPEGNIASSIAEMALVRDGTIVVEAWTQKAGSKRQ